MELTLTTPALLFSTLSLLMLAFTNRFLALASRIRELEGKWEESGEELYLGQIENLRRRVELIRLMQFFGIGSLLLCVVCMFCLFAGWERAGAWVFGGALIALMISLGMSLREIQMSAGALRIHLRRMEQRLAERKESP